MKTEDIFCQLFGFSKNTYYSWKREKKPIIELLNKYFTKDELLEYIETDKISNMQLLEDFKAKEEESIKTFLSLLTLLYKKDGLDQIDNDTPKSNYLQTFSEYLHFTNQISEDTFMDFALTKENRLEITSELKFLLPLILGMDEYTKFLIEREKNLGFINLVEYKKQGDDKQAFEVFLKNQKIQTDSK